jgi:signal transduction histidine kinase/streptogramin lyase
MKLRRSSHVLATTTCGLALCLGPTVSRAQPSSIPLDRTHHATWAQSDSLMLAGSSRVLRSPDGYLWLAHPLGLIRFDGVRFALVDSTRFPELRSERPGIYLPQIVDRSGAMWVSRPDGALLTYRDGALKVAVPASARAGADVIEDGAGRVLVWQRRAFQLWVWRNERLEPVALPPEMPRTLVLGVVRDTADGIWIGFREHGLWHLRNGVARHIRSPIVSDENAVRPLLQARDGALWADGNGLGRSVVRLEGDRWTRVPVNGDASRSFFGRTAIEEPNGAIWFGTLGNGLVRWDGQRLERVGSRVGLSSANVQSLLLDDEGSLWLTTDAGLDRLRSTPLFMLSADDGLPTTTASGIVEDKGGHLWIASHPGGAIYRIDGGRFREHRGPLRVDSVPRPNAVSFQLLTAARAGGAWVAPYLGGLGRLDDAGLRRVDGQTPALQQIRVIQALDARDGTLWLAFLRRGLGWFRDGRYERVPLPDSSAVNVSDMTEDSRGHVWVSVADGPFLYAMADGRVARRLGPDDGVTEPIGHLAFERGDTLWALGETTILRIVGGKVSRVGVASIGHMLRARSAALVADDRLWIAGEAGIVHLSLDTLHRIADGATDRLAPVVLGAVDGAPVPKTPAVTLQPITRTRDGHIWIATPTGIAVVDPARRTRNSRPPRVVIEDVSVGGRPLNPSATHTIGPRLDRVDIRFTATSLHVPERVRVEYRLEGADEGWRTAGVPRLASYTQLRPGNYRFRVRAWNEDGVSAADEASLGFRVLPMWYQTWWFVALVLATVAATSAATLALVQRARHRRRAEALQATFRATLEERTRLARELHDTLLQGFTGIVLQLEGLRHLLRHSHAPSAEQLSRILTLADSALFDARQSVWDMRSKSLEERSLAEAIQETAVGLTTGSPVAVRFATRGDPRTLAPTVQAAMLHIGREALRNAVHHASAQAVDVVLQYDDAETRLVVRDDGVGMQSDPIASNGTSGHFGIVGMRERATRAGGSLSITSAPGTGTRVELVLPT